MLRRSNPDAVRILRAEATHERFTLWVKETNSSSKPYQVPNSANPKRLRLTIRAGMLKWHHYDCAPGDSTFWTALYGDFVGVGTVVVNPGMTVDFFITYRMPDSTIDILRTGQHDWTIQGLGIRVKGRHSPDLFSEDLIEVPGGKRGVW